MAFVTWRRSWDPLRELQHEVDRLFDSIGPTHSWRATRQYPAINLFEVEDEYLLTAELPGAAKEDLNVSLAGQVLTLKAQRRPRGDASAESFRRRERPVGEWTRSVSLPERVDGSQVSAELSAGILKVHLPKTEEARPRQIPVATD